MVPRAALEGPPKLADGSVDERGMADILLVDDDDGVRRFLKRALELQDHRVTTARNGAEALKLYQAGAPSDVVITDIVMPDHDGIGLIAKLRRASPKQPILAISGGGSRLSSGTLLEIAEGFGVHVLAKPFSLAEFQKAIDEVLAPVAEATS